jgi:hypothetical protein
MRAAEIRVLAEDMNETDPKAITWMGIPDCIAIGVLIVTSALLGARWWLVQHR